jgi:hypothetical protein
MFARAEKNEVRVTHGHLAAVDDFVAAEILKPPQRPIGFNKVQTTALNRRS